jgi:hypothetical protein
VNSWCTVFATGLAAFARAKKAIYKRQALSVDEIAFASTSSSFGAGLSVTRLVILRALEERLAKRYAGRAPPQPSEVLRFASMRFSKA